MLPLPRECELGRPWKRASSSLVFWSSFRSIHPWIRCGLYRSPERVEPPSLPYPSHSHYRTAPVMMVPPPSPPLSPPSVEQPLTLATLTDDVLAMYAYAPTPRIATSSAFPGTASSQPSFLHVIENSAIAHRLIQLLHESRELLPLALTAKTFNRIRRQLQLELITDGRNCVRRLRLLEWACWHLPTGCSWLEHPLHQTRGCVWAAGAGCLPAILWLRGEGLWLCGEDCLAAAAHGGHHEVIIALWKLGCSADWRCCAWAASEGHLFTLMVARRLGFVWDEMTAANAAGAGELALLQWCRQPDYSSLQSLRALLCTPASSPYASPDRSPLQSRDPLSAANDTGRSCRPSSDRVLRQQNAVPPRPVIAHCHRPCSPCSPPASPPLSHIHLARLEATPCDTTPAPWDAWTIAAAAGGGHLEVLEYIWSCDEERGRPAANSQSCAFAAACGHTDVLKWLRERDAPWDEQTCSEAAQGGHLATLIWCRESGCPWDVEAACAAAGAGHLEVLKWCESKGCPWDGPEVVQRAQDGGFEAVAAWARTVSRGGQSWPSSPEPPSDFAATGAAIS